MLSEQARATVRRFTKLRAMSVNEVATRVRYKALLVSERRRHQKNSLVSPERLCHALRRDLRQGEWQQKLLAERRKPSTQFFASVTQPARLQHLFATRYRGEREDMLRHATAARAHRFEFFGGEYQYGPEIDWHADPVSGKRWPVVYHVDVPVNCGDVGYGDVKHVWELGRQQYLIDLAKSWFVTGTSEDLLALQRLVASWIDSNPYGTGVHWACALEPAFRAWSWLWAYQLTCDALDREFHLAWLASIHDHGRFLADHLELYSSPYNHLIGEASALYALGLAFPQFEASTAWAAQAKHVLESRLGEQFYSDGGSVEQSTFYHHATTGFYLLATIMGRGTPYELCPTVTAAVERGIEYSMHMVQPDGHIPTIGGADDGKPIRMEHLPFWDFRPYQAIGAVLFGRSDFKAVAGRFYEDALWLLGADGADQFDALPTVAPAATRIELRGSGYFVDRTDWSPRASYVCFDIGEQAAGMRPDSIPNSMHGHADCLSIVLCLDGRRVLVDSGLFAYNCGGDWEAHFRETAAHNTARIDGADQARHLGKMAWSNSYRPSVEARYADDTQSWTIGSHDGYARTAQGVVHRRAVWLRPGGYVLVFDEFVGAGEHDLEINFQFAPGDLVTLPGGGAQFESDIRMAWAGSGDWIARVSCGGPKPSDGWICPSLGVRVAAPRLTLESHTGERRVGVISAFAAGSTGAPSIETVKADDGRAAVLRIAGDGFVDWVAGAVVSDGGPIESDALLAVCRLDATGAVVERVATAENGVRVQAGALRRLEAVAQARRKQA